MWFEQLDNSLTSLLQCFYNHNNKEKNMKIDMSNIEKTCDIAEQVEKMNNSEEMESENLVLTLFEIDNTITNDAGLHPVVGATWADFGCWQVFKPHYFENTYCSTNKSNADLVAIIQSDHPLKKNANSYEMTAGSVKVLKNSVEFIQQLNDSRYIAVISYDSGLYNNNLVIVRKNEMNQDVDVEAFYIDHNPV